MTTLEKQNKKTPKDLKRRTFLTYIMFSGLAFVSGRVLNSISGSSISKSVSNETKKKIGDFNIKESNKGLTLHDKDNNEILIISNT
ncbi:hypothetical protein ACFL6I_05375 [candidate division KSB1 bacterium]